MDEAQGQPQRCIAVTVSDDGKGCTGPERLYRCRDGAGYSAPKQLCPRPNGLSGQLNESSMSRLPGLLRRSYSALCSRDLFNLELSPMGNPGISLPNHQPGAEPLSSRCPAPRRSTWRTDGRRDAVLCHRLAARSIRRRWERRRSLPRQRQHSAGLVGSAFPQPIRGRFTNPPNGPDRRRCKVRWNQSRPSQISI